MRRILNFTLAAIAIMAMGCHKDGVLTTLAKVSFTGTIKASAASVVMTTKTDSTSVETFTWPAVTYPVKAHVTYTLQVDLPADTVGSTAWANATVVNIGNDILTYTFKGADFNNLALNVGIPANGTGTLVFRIKAYQDRAVYTSGAYVAVTTYKAIPAFSHNWSVLYLPGFYQGWSPGTAGTVAAEQTGIYEGFVYMPTSTDPSAYHFKFTSAADWNHINYGNGATTGTLTTDGTAGDLVLPAAGFYELVANTTTLTWTATPMTWGIIGDATPGGWNADTQMAYNATTGVWTVTAAMLSTGSFKFRANNAWSIDFGIDANGRLAYADNPAYPYNGTLNNLTVPTSGNYTITLDLRNANNYTYTIKKN